MCLLEEISRNAPKGASAGDGLPVLMRQSERRIEMTEERTMELLYMAEKMIDEKLPEDQYLDDERWGNGCFKIFIFRNVNKPVENPPINYFYWSYDEDLDDTFDIDDKAQVIKEVEEFLDMYYD